MPHLLGLMGKRQSGKDTLAGFLADDHAFSRVAFADPLRGVLLATDPLIPTSPYVYRRLSEVIATEGWDEAKENYPEIRRLLQYLGTEGVRAHLGETQWIDAALRTVLDNLDAGRSVVVTDVRYPNEGEAIREAGGLLVRVTRPEREASPHDAHASETALDDVRADVTVNNVGTLDDLREAARQLARDLDA